MPFVFFSVNADKLVLTEMASAYATIQNEGKYREPTCIVKILDAEGKTIVPAGICRSRQVAYTRWIIAPNPYSCRIVRREPTEPSVFFIICRTCFAFECEWKVFWTYFTAICRGAVKKYDCLAAF